MVSQVCGRLPFKSGTRDLKPDPDNDVGSQFFVLYADSPFGNRLGGIRLEVGANPVTEHSWRLCALNHEACPCGVRNRLFQEIREAEGESVDGIANCDHGRRQHLIKTFRKFLADRCDQVIHALEMIIERTLRDACRRHRIIYRYRRRMPLRKELRPRLQDLRPRLRSRPISALRAKSIFAINPYQSFAVQNVALTI